MQLCGGKKRIDKVLITFLSLKTLNPLKVHLLHSPHFFFNPRIEQIVFVCTFVNSSLSNRSFQHSAVPITSGISYKICPQSSR